MANVAPATSEAPDWAAQASETLEDLDEPPEPRIHMPTPKTFQRSAVRRPAEHHQPSLLTKAILGQFDDDGHVASHSTKANSQRRQSMVSNFSVASTDLTSDTGFTSPSRASTPSPPLPDISMLRLHSGLAGNKTSLLGNILASHQETVREAPRKRSIQFACAAQPMAQQQPAAAAPMPIASSEQEAPRRPRIKFACQARPSPACTQNTPAKPEQNPTVGPSPSNKVEPSTPKKGSIPSTAPIPLRPSPIRRLSKGPVTRPRFLRADSKDLVKDGSQFHEFASGIAREDDWIRNDNSTMQTKLTIYDTLTKENRIRRLATEAEEEAKMEEEEAEGALDDDDNEDEDDEDVDDLDGEDEDENEDDNDDGDCDSDGYHTDEETGFAESDDDEDDGDENMVLWTPSRAIPVVGSVSGMRLARRPSVNEQHSDSSIASKRSVRRVKARPIGPQAEAPDLPDSTDFVCGTLDEDRPVEEAYLSCLAARRNEKLRIIPQDIDPSFPASDLDEEDEEGMYNAVHYDSDQNVWLHGSMEDLHHDQDRSRRRRKNEHTSPRRLRSPPPKRHQSPAPKARGRSPKLLFDRHSPRKMRSPAPKAMTTPSQTPRQGAHIKFNLAGRPGLTQTKSLPRPAALFRYVKHLHKSSRNSSENDVHVRGAIDIVKGLEKKRQRRKEKFYQKYCNRARRGQIPERKPLPGRGAERMKELGLLMAGKKDQGNYVLSI